MTQLCTVITAKSVDEALELMSSVRTDLIELRLDYIANIQREDIKRLLDNDKDIIVTCRPINEGGHFEGSEENRIELLKEAITCGASYVDIEHNTHPESIKALLMDKSDCKIIISHHNFEATPSLDELQDLYETMNNVGADYVKIVTHAQSINDCFVIFELLKGKGNLIAMCMGLRGHMTRILGPKFGSHIVYASLDDAKTSAPGQITANELLDVYNFESVNKDTRILGVIGAEAQNSKSKYMHNTNFVKQSINMIYLPLKVRPEELSGFMQNYRKYELRGSAVTVPHKEHIIDCIDNLDETAKVIGATNTLVQDEKIIGYNTDYFGAVEALKEKTTLHGTKSLVIGAGGAARALLYGLKKEESEITIINRTQEKAQKLADEFSVQCADIKDMKKLVQDHDIIINTTSVGMNPHADATIIDPSYLTEGKIIMDIVYNPIDTVLIKDARDKNCVAITGDRMLIYQAVGQFKLWTGITPKFKDMEQALTKFVR